jgi:hypothetical protein
MLLMVGNGLGPYPGPVAPSLLDHRAAVLHEMAEIEVKAVASVVAGAQAHLGAQR